MSRIQLNHTLIGFYLFITFLSSKSDVGGNSVCHIVDLSSQECVCNGKIKNILLNFGLETQSNVLMIESHEESIKVFSITECYSARVLWKHIFMSPQKERFTFLSIGISNQEFIMHAQQHRRLSQGRDQILPFQINQHFEQWS